MRELDLRGHVHFMLFGSISFALGSQRELIFQWNMGLTINDSKVYCGKSCTINILRAADLHCPEKDLRLKSVRPGYSTNRREIMRPNY